MTGSVKQQFQRERKFYIFGNLKALRTNLFWLKGQRYLHASEKSVLDDIYNQVDAIVKNYKRNTIEVEKKVFK
jgi:hypothetical protein